MADVCEIQLSYAIGYSKPISVCVDCQGTSKIDEDDLVDTGPAIDRQALSSSSHPALQVHVRNRGDVVRVEMGQEDAVEAAHRHSRLGHAERGSGAHVEEQEVFFSDHRDTCLRAVRVVAERRGASADDDAHAVEGRSLGREVRADENAAPAALRPAQQAAPAHLHWEYFSIFCYVYKLSSPQIFEILYLIICTP